MNLGKPDSLSISNQEHENRPKRQARGEIIIGEIDPRTLGQEEFDTLPGLLYHVADSPFKFDQKTPYSDRRTGLYSSTVGHGLYCTDNFEGASNYMQDRGKTPQLMKFRADKAKMFDFRDITDPSYNAPVPRQLFEKFRDFIIQEYEKMETNGRDATSLTNIRQHRTVLILLGLGRFDLLSQIMQNLPGEVSTLTDRFLPNQQEFDLRTVLSRYAKRGYGTETIAYLFTKFILQDGYDGIIYIEGGDSVEFDTPSYVFF